MRIEDGCLCQVYPSEINEDGSFEIPYGVTAILEDVFRDYLDLKRINLPSSLISIRADAFNGCSNLTKINIPDSVTDIESGVFAGCSSLREINIPDGVTSIGEATFNGCSSLTKVNIPDSVTSIGREAFCDCSSLAEINIPESVTSIGSGVFASCSSLTKINIPDSVTSIGPFAFYICSRLTEISIPDSVTSIGISTFRDCSSLRKINIPDSVASIGNFAFDNCSRLTKIDIPESVSSIGDFAFKYCSSLTEINIPDSVTSIGRDAFNSCSSLAEINIPESVTSIGSGVFAGCSSLRKINIPDSVTSIGREAFCGCSSLAEVNIPDSVTSIGINAFHLCSSLTKINIPDSVRRIEEGAFKDCSSLTEINIPESVTSIECGVFCGCSSLAKINIPVGVGSIGMDAFNNCSNLKEVKLPDSLTKIYGGTFKGCKGLTEIVIPKNVKSIARGTFSGCDNLASVHIENRKFDLEELFLTPFGSIASTGVFDSDIFNNIYLNSDGTITLCRQPSAELEEKAVCNIALEVLSNENLFKGHYRCNYAKVHTWKKEGKIKFIPPDYTLKVFPEEEMDKYFLNKNNQRWGKLVKELGFTGLEGSEKENALSDLLKIYYAIGGFSSNQGESERAYEYIKKYVAKTKNPNSTSSEIGAEIHRRFSRINLKGPYNKDFATFFMKYYKDNPDFMCFRLKDQDGDLMDPQDYICSACNNFSAIQKAYPNRLVNTNEERAKFSPKFIAEHSSFVAYDFVEEGNEELAYLIGRYCYSQEKFERMQEVFNEAKEQKDKFAISADKADESGPVQFRLLAKDDPMGFVLGDITNCCQHFGGAAESCVIDGYENPNAGFMVFEEAIKDENGKPTEETRILGQAYVWYDPNTKTICYDNIEIPSCILCEVSKKNSALTKDMIMSAVEKSAEAIMRSMNRGDEIKVERVTTGEDYSDLKDILNRKYKKETSPKAKRGGCVYSDAENVQYIIKEYDEVTKLYEDDIAAKLAAAEKNIGISKTANPRTK